MSLTIFASTVLYAGTESEWNGNKFSANSITQNSTTTGDTDKNDPDFFKFTASTDLSITITTSNYAKKMSVLLMKGCAWDSVDLTSTTSSNNAADVIITYSVISGTEYCIGLSTADSTSRTYTLTVEAQGINHNPTANNKTFSTIKNTTLANNLMTSGGTADSDPDGDTPLTTSRTTNPTKGSVTVNSNGTFTYIPTTGQTGTDSFTYTLSDGKGGTATASVTINITSNDPIANNKSFTTPTDTPKTANVISNGGTVDSDPNGDTISVSANTEPSHGNVTIATNGDFTYTPNSAYTGTDTFDYTVTDGILSATATVTIQIYAVGDEPIPNTTVTGLTPVCGTFEDVMQTRSNPSKISNKLGASADIFNSPDCTLNTGDIDFGLWQHLSCSGGDAAATASYGQTLTVNYSNSPVAVSVNSAPSSSATNLTLVSSQTVIGSEYNKIEVGSGSTGSLNITFSELQKINILNFTINNTVNFSAPTPYNLEIGSVGIVNNGSGNSLATSTIPKNIKIKTFDLPGKTTIDFEATQTIKMETLKIGRADTSVKLKAPYVQINTLNQSNTYNGVSNVEIIADYVDIGTLQLDQEATITFKPYTSGQKILFRANSIAASSSSTMIVDSGNYYTKSFSIPGSSNVSSIRASDANQIINFYIDGDFAPGNSPGINSTGNSGNFGTLPPSNFFFFVNGDVTTGGGGTTFNATIYVEGSADFGSPTYLKGAVSTGGNIEIGNGSKFYFDQSVENGDWSECGNSIGLIDQNAYSCGIFPSVLASYKSISVEQNDVFNTCKISVKDFNLEESSQHNVSCYTGIDDSTPLCRCTGEHCSANNSCEIIPEPTNKYSHEFVDTTIAGTISGSGNIEFKDLYYPSYTIAKSGNDKSVTFNPDYTYDGSTKKVMVFGDVDFTSNGQILTFEEGDYYFNSLTLDNSPELFINGDVRFFIKNDFTYSGNNMNVINGGSLFLYIGGDLNFASNGGGSGFLDMFIYVVGDANVQANSNAASLFGGITAEGSVNITGNNMNFIYNEAGAESIGYGECKLCYVSDPNNHTGISMGPLSIMMTTVTPIVNNSNETLKDVAVEESFNTTFNFGGSLDVQDENGNHVAGSSTSSDADKIFMMSHGGGSNTYTFGPAGATYAPSSSYQTKQSSLFSFSSFSDWEATVRYVAQYTDSSDRDYEVILDTCSVGGSSNEPVLGLYDAWDNSTSDKNITTKIASQDFALRIVSLDENGDARIKQGVDAKFRLYDYHTNSSVTSWYDFSSSTQSSIAQTFSGISSAYKDVRVQFRYCQYTADKSLVPYSVCESGTQGHDFNTSVASTDNFAIRPDKFIIIGPSGKDINLLTSAQNYNFSLIATPYLSTLGTNNYNITDAPSVLNINKIIYNIDNSDATATLNGTLTLLNSPSYDIVNGTATDVVGINFTDVGKVNIQLKDISWASVDINHDTTPVNCSTNGAYICGSNDATFIPDHFTLTNVHLDNSNQGAFTYFSSDLNMSAHLAVTIEAQNALNAVTQNFKSGSWENPVNFAINVATTSTPGIIQDDINDSVNLNFALGTLTIPWNETNNTKMLRFNFIRANDIPINPFIVNGTDVTLTAMSDYGGTEVTGTSVADQNATFVYGRTNAPRQVFEGATGTIPIFYEVYCDVVECQNALLPNGVASISNDDPRWFTNAQHTDTSGTATLAGTTITQKSAAFVTQTTAPTGNHQDSVFITYDQSRGYPYKATMLNTPSSWLLYNQYNAATVANEFEVEFYNTGGSWAGTHETNTSTTNNGSSVTNRRTMW